MKTYQPKKDQVKRMKVELDAASQVLGRFASKVAFTLMGKHKSDYSPHMDNGDYVVVKNSEKIVVTGKKFDDKVYQSHSGYPGGFKEVSYKSVFKRNPSRVISMAVYNMLPPNRLRDKRMKRLIFS